MSTSGSDRSWVPYVIPMVVFLGLTYVEGKLPDYYIAIYAAKVILVAFALYLCRSVWSDIKFESKYILPGLVIGIALCGVWVFLEESVTYKHLGERSAFNPFAEIGSSALQYSFIALRFIGLVLLVPVMEELFWRSFLLRFATKPDFKSLPIGSFSLGAFLFVTALFALAHPDWLPAAVYAAALGIMVKVTRSIFACIVTHAATNAALGVYVLSQGAWKYW